MTLIVYPLSVLNADADGGVPWLGICPTPTFTYCNTNGGFQLKSSLLGWKLEPGIRTRYKQCTPLWKSGGKYDERIAVHSIHFNCLGIGSIQSYDQLAGNYCWVPIKGWMMSIGLQDYVYEYSMTIHNSDPWSNSSYKSRTPRQRTIISHDLHIFYLSPERLSVSSINRFDSTSKLHKGLQIAQ